MSTEEEQIERILQSLKQIVDRKVEEFSERIPIDKVVKPFSDYVKKREEKIKAEKEMKRIFKTVFSIGMKPLFELDGMMVMAKRGLANVLSALGQNPKIDGTLKGCSGNEYKLAVVADSTKRLLIADQSMSSSELLLPWLKAQMPKTFDSFKSSIADFFKYLDIFYKVVKQKPTVYWIHDYKPSRSLVEKAGFSFKRLMREMLFEIGRLEGLSDTEIEKHMLTDEEFQKILHIFDTTMSELFSKIEQFGIKFMSSSSLPFDIHKATNVFRIPLLSIPLLNMLEMSLLDPKSPSERRALIGYAYELGLLDFWDPPWPDYILKTARFKKSTSVDVVRKILMAGTAVGHPAREAHGISPQEILKRPYEGLEILQQNGLLEVNKQKDTYILTSPGFKIKKEIERRPKKHALRKALDLVKGVSILFPPIQFKFKDEEN